MPKMIKARSEGNQFIALQHTAPASDLGLTVRQEEGLAAMHDPETFNRLKKAPDCIE
jgi:hypothetical protein